MPGRRPLLAFLTILALAAPLPAAAEPLWPEDPECGDAFDDEFLRVRACAGGNVCQVVGDGATHVLVCVHPSVCPNLGDLRAAEDVCLPAYDRDNDGVGAENGDCDDNDPSTYPGAADDTPDGVDNDCDGVADDDLNQPVDADGDGWIAGDDCDDANPSVNPGAVEDPHNGVDDDCDGYVDETYG